jgi:hypothetical protein
MSTRIDIKSTAVSRSTATLIKTGQITSYRTGDDGDIEAGRDISFFLLDENNPFGNNKRFTDELGTLIYTNNIVIDWSTYDGATVLGYRRTPNSVDINWNDAIDQSLAVSIGTFTTGWRLTNIKELQNIWNGSSSLGFDYSPINIGNVQLWSSNTLTAATTVAWHTSTYGQIVYQAKTNSGNLRFIPCRTFTVTGTTLT